MSDNSDQRDNYKYFTDITTRWMDNDIYGHVNNVVYYSYFDSVANKFLIEEGGLDIHRAEVIGFVVASSCQYKSPIAYPDKIDAGFRVNKLGNSSVEYGIAIFKQGAETASAVGTFTHVFVDRASDKSVAIPAQIRNALEKIVSSG
ncbi:acyl-CoA thioesterase [Porticoccaceae bacterium]|nr:acyl-CoA thioesterase [Porticoccaceae bacterium]